MTFLTKIDIENYTPNLTDAIIANQNMEGNPEDLSLRKLFKELCPTNTTIEDILIKCTTLNKLYSTNIYQILPVAEHILQLNIDARLRSGDITLVEDIANVTTLNKRYYSFATKYCAMHEPNLFSIYDSNVHKVLMHYYKQKFTYNCLRDYKSYYHALRMFKKDYHLETLTLWELDKYLWQLGNKF